MSGAHARLAPSNHRWPHCPGSVREEAAYPDQSGEAAVDGTGSHLLLELCLEARKTNKDVKAIEWLDRTIGEGHHDRPQGWWVKKDRCERVQMALDYITRRESEINILQIESEIQSNPGYYFKRNDWYGTVDVLLVSNDTIEIIDFKDGQGWVDVKDNSQLLGYGGGRLAPFILTKIGDGQFDFDLDSCNIKTVRTTIVQPKTKTPIRYEDYTSAELWGKVKELASAAYRTDEENATLVAGKWCQWCKHGKAGNCSAKTQIALEGVSQMTTTTDGKESLLEAIQSGQISPGTMTDVQLASILDAAPLITKMIEQVEEEAMTRAENGTEIPGYTIGSGNNKRIWADEPEIVEKKLKGMRFKKGDIYPAKLLSPAQALKYPDLSDRQKAAIEKLIKTVPGKAKLVQANKAIQKQPVADMFNQIPDFNNVPSFM